MPNRDVAMTEFLSHAGITRETTAAALDIDGVIQRWRRRVIKRELGSHALRALELDSEIDLAQLDVLIAIWAPANEFGEDQGRETMIATVAERLGIDPSRASRLVSDLIGKGLARRAVSQQDARRTIVELTARGHAIVTAVRHFKFLVMGEFLSGWTQEEIDTFLPLFERFSAWADEAGGIGPERFPEQVGEIVEGLRLAGAESERSA